MTYNFGPATEGDRFVFGAASPTVLLNGNITARIDAWIDFMQSNGIARVICLLPDDQLRFFRSDRGGLLDAYEAAFGALEVLHVPVADFSLIKLDDLLRVANFLKDGILAAKPTVMHCFGGIGRTGHVLAAWLALSQGLDPDTAIAAVSKTEAVRDPREAVAGGVREEDLIALLNAAKELGKRAP